MIMAFMFHHLLSRKNDVFLRDVMWAAVIPEEVMKNIIKLRHILQEQYGREKETIWYFFLLINLWKMCWRCMRMSFQWTGYDASLRHQGCMNRKKRNLSKNFLHQKGHWLDFVWWVVFFRKVLIWWGRNWSGRL